MANYAEDTDLQVYETNLLEESGVASFEDQLTLASADILNKIKSSWWTQASPTSTISDFDESKLNVGIIKQLTVYKAFADYIFPKLANFMEDDTFLKKAEFYKEKYREEWDVVKGLPLYDFDGDTEFEDSERRGPIVREVGRA